MERVNPVRILIVIYPAEVVVAVARGSSVGSIYGDELVIGVVPIRCYPRQCIDGLDQAVEGIVAVFSSIFFVRRWARIYLPENIVSSLADS